MLNFCMCIWTQILNLNLVWNYKFQIEFKKEKNRKLKRKEKKGRGIPAPGPKNTLASPTPFHASPLPLLSHAAHLYVVTLTAGPADWPPTACVACCWLAVMWDRAASFVSSPVTEIAVYRGWPVQPRRNPRVASDPWGSIKMLPPTLPCFHHWKPRAPI